MNIHNEYLLESREVNTIENPVLISQHKELTGWVRAASSMEEMPASGDCRSPKSCRKKSINN